MWEIFTKRARKERHADPVGRIGYTEELAFAGKGV